MLNWLKSLFGGAQEGEATNTDNPQTGDMSATAPQDETVEAPASEDAPAQEEEAPVQEEVSEEPAPEMEAPVSESPEEVAPAGEGSDSEEIKESIQ